jgi:hypothetical protein
MAWSLEDSERNENESANAAKVILEFLDSTDYTDWFELREEGQYNADLSRGIEQTLMMKHEALREHAKAALRQLMALAAETRDELHDALDLDDEVPASPPGHTCPAIDKAQRSLRQLEWRVRNPDKSRVDTSAILKEGLDHLEEVRRENKQMRRAHAEAEARYREVAKSLFAAATVGGVA